MSVPHPSQSQYTLYNHQSTHLPLALLFLPASGCLTATLHLHMFFSTVTKSKYSFVLSNMSYFYGLENPGTFGVPNRIFRDTETELFRFRKNETDPENPGRM
jgi:hypothetical protein